MSHMGVLNQMNDSTRMDEHGVVLVIALLMLVLLSILGILVINLSATNIQTAAFEKLSTQSFSGAESGLTQARSDMQGFVILGPQNGQWPAADNTVINAVMALPPRCNGATCAYSLTVSGQSVAFNYGIVDFGTNNDRTVLVTSTGSFLNVSQRIEAVLRYEPPNLSGAQECYSSKCTSVDQNSGGAVANRVNSTVAL